jgi:hypothetical protein
VVTLLIGELGVRPRRADWRQVLSRHPLSRRTSRLTTCPRFQSSKPSVRSSTST